MTLQTDDADFCAGGLMVQPRCCLGTSCHGAAAVPLQDLNQCARHCEHRAPKPRRKLVAPESFKLRHQGFQAACQRLPVHASVQPPIATTASVVARRCVSRFVSAPSHTRRGVDPRLRPARQGFASGRRIPSLCAIDTSPAPGVRFWIKAIITQYNKRLR